MVPRAGSRLPKADHLHAAIQPIGFLSRGNGNVATGIPMNCVPKHMPTIWLKHVETADQPGVERETWCPHAPVCHPLWVLPSQLGKALDWHRQKLLLARVSSCTDEVLGQRFWDPNQDTFSMLRPPEATGVHHCAGGTCAALLGRIGAAWVRTSLARSYNWRHSFSDAGT